MCFSFGVASSVACGGTPLPAAFTNLDMQDAWSFVSNTPCPSSSPDGSDALAMILYILGGVAAAASLVAILLVFKLRRPQEPSILISGRMVSTSAATAPTVGYGTHQEERYKVVEKIGEGAFSVVYLVRRNADGAVFAMKHMECQSDVQRQEAIKECEIIRTLQGHPNVICLIDMFMNYEFEAAPRPATSASASVEQRKKPSVFDGLDALTGPRDGGAVDSTNGGTTDPLLPHDSPQLNPSPTTSRHLCLVMEYHPAGDLRQWVLRQPPGRIPDSIIASIAFQVCSVLKHIHAQQPAVMHRDIKPENILISSSEAVEANRGRFSRQVLLSPAQVQDGSPSAKFLPVVLTDFGLARMQERSYCASGAGTLPYVAPECFKKRYTVQCDMWSVGCVIYALATRRVTSQTVRLHFQDALKSGYEESLRADLAGKLSPEMVEFTVRLLQPDPSKRLKAEEACRLFRRRGGAVYITSKILSGDIAAAVSPDNAQTAEQSLATLLRFSDGDRSSGTTSAVRLVDGVAAGMTPSPPPRTASSAALQDHSLLPRELSPGETPRQLFA
jgi:serine/threonine protein kinase